MTIKLISLLGLFFVVQAFGAREPFPGGMIITEWDLAFPNKETLNRYYENPNNKLIVAHKPGNAFDVWSKGDRLALSYCISNEFKDRKRDVIEAMRVATEDWMDVAGVRFYHKKMEDSRCTANNKAVKFDIRPVNVGMYLARAFFPSYPRENRNVLIDESSFRFSFVAMAGFLRHELGHVLGFRHEHIHKSSNGSCREGGAFTPVTSYDQFSVMHYPQCGGKNLLENMILSELDRQGAEKVYPRFR